MEQRIVGMVVVVVQGCRRPVHLGWDLDKLEGHPEDFHL